MTSSHLDLFDPPAPPPLVRPAVRSGIGRAYGGLREFLTQDGNPDPFEMTVRGVGCTVSYCLGTFATTVADGVGSPFWSCTGYRSFGLALYGPDAVSGAVEDYIDRPVKRGGLGGRLVRWWPGWVLQWRDDRSLALTMDRSTMWSQWGPERQAEELAGLDARIAAAEARMWADGIDPNEVGAPPSHVGAWPKVERS